jgi:hypothetical protein
MGGAEVAMQSPRGPVEKAGMSRMLAQPSAALTKPGLAANLSTRMKRTGA